MREERSREGACGLLYEWGALEKLAVAVVVSWARIGRASGGVAELGSGVHDTRVLEGCG
jgi:hypothetical protein